MLAGNLALATATAFAGAALYIDVAEQPSTGSTRTRMGRHGR